MNRNPSLGYVAALALAGAALLDKPGNAKVRLPHILSSHMVLQRDKPMHVWGWAAPGEAITVRLDGAEGHATTDRLGHWNVTLPSHAAGGPYQMEVDAASGATVLDDVLVGDVWVASGQSNMEMPLKGFGNNHVKGGEEAAAAAHDKDLRLLLIRHRASVFPQDDVEDSWTVATPQTARDFSAVAYFFAREIRDREKVPVGIVDATWGGTAIESWTSNDGLTRDPNYPAVMRVAARFLAGQADREALLAAEKREDAEAKAAGRPAPAHPWHPDPESWVPSGLYNGMIAPLTPMTVRGFLWYQGETNSALERAALYGSLMQTLVTDWRRSWTGGGEGDALPFYWTQISSYRSTTLEAWGVLRDQQRRALTLGGTGMAVTLDVGNPADVHPQDKVPVGHRLALLARAGSYGETGLVYAGPLFERATVEDGAMRAWFQPATAEGLRCEPAGCVGFEVAGADHRFVPAEARVDGRSVRVSAASIAQPQFVRYAWPNAPKISLVNGAGLPASTFTSEELPEDVVLPATSYGQVE